MEKQETTKALFWESDPAGTVKRLYDDVDKDIRGVPRSRYRELARQKENEHNVRPLYSKGFYRQELFNSVEYVDSFTGKKTDIDDEIDGLKKAGCEIVEIENDKDQTRIWFTLHEKQKLTVFPGEKPPNNIFKVTGFNQHGEKVHRIFQGFPNTPGISEKNMCQKHKSRE